MVTPKFDDVLAAAKAGEEWAFDALFHQWNSPMTGFVRARGVRDVGDVVNEVFLAAFTTITRFRGNEADFRAWIYRIARNKIADRYRQGARRPATRQLTEADDLIAGDVAQDVDALFGEEHVVQLLSALTDEQREVLTLRIIADLTIPQIAKIMGKRRGAVKQLQRRALLRLEAQLEEESQESSLRPYPLDDDQR